jgi:hypothetical protein
MNTLHVSTSIDMNLWKYLMHKSTTQNCNENPTTPQNPCPFILHFPKDMTPLTPLPSTNCMCMDDGCERKWFECDCHHPYMTPQYQKAMKKAYKISLWNLYWLRLGSLFSRHASWALYHFLSHLFDASKPLSLSLSHLFAFLFGIFLGSLLVISTFAYNFIILLIDWCSTTLCHHNL